MGTVLTTVFLAHFPHVEPEVAQQKTGSCRETTDFVVYVYRTLGISVLFNKKEMDTLFC